MSTTIDGSGSLAFSGTVSGSSVVSTGGGTFATDIQSASQNGGPLAGFRNKVINGNFDVWQRGTSFAGVSPYYGPDRWQVYRSGAAAGASFSRANNISNVSTYALQIQRNSGDTNLSSIFVATSFETLEVYQFQGKQVTLSFQAAKGANFSGSTFTAQIFSGTGTDSSLTTGFTGQTTLITSNYTLTSGFVIYTATITIPINSTQLGIAFSWVPTGTAGASDFIYLTGIQLEISPVATPFERRPIGVELALCQRYCEVIGNNVFFAYGTLRPNGTASYNLFQTAQIMRATPTISFSSGTGVIYSGDTSNALTAIGNANGSPNSNKYWCSSTHPNIGANGQATVIYTGSSYLTLSSEL